MGFADVDLIGFSSDGRSFAFRYVYPDVHLISDNKSFCDYPVINGKTPGQLTLFMHTAGEGDSRWIVYRNAVLEKTKPQQW